MAEDGLVEEDGYPAECLALSFVCRHRKRRSKRKLAAFPAEREGVVRGAQRDPRDQRQLAGVLPAGDGSLQVAGADRSTHEQPGAVAEGRRWATGSAEAVLACRASGSGGAAGIPGRLGCLGTQLVSPAGRRPPPCCRRSEGGRPPLGSDR